MPPRTDSLVLQLGTLAATQHGVVTRAQALAGGVSAAAIERRVATGEWIAVDYGVYRFAVTPESWHQRVLAACLAGPAIASHRTAARLLGVPGFSDVAAEVTALRHRRRKSSDVVWHESFHLDDIDIVRIDAIPTTNACRTLLDLGSVLDPVGLVSVYDELVRRRLVRSTEVLARLDQLGPRRRGAHAVRRVVATRIEDGRVPQSALETEFDALLRRFGLPEPVRQYVVMDGAAFVARLDFAYPAARVDMEVDGAQWHTPDAAQHRDRHRDDRLGQLGWIVLRFTPWDIRFRPEWVVSQVRCALRDRGALIGPIDRSPKTPRRSMRP